MHILKRSLIAIPLFLMISCTKPPPKPDIILITWDTTRADHIGPENKNNNTPWAMKLAEEGFRFTEARTTAPFTLPAHASLLTGQLPHKHGLRLNSDGPLPEKNLSIPEVFQQHGYKTAAFVSSSVMAAETGLSQGFDLYDDHILAAGEQTHLPARKAQDTLTAALSWLTTQPKEAPIFLFVHLFEPHRPWIPPIELLKDFKGDSYRALINIADTQTGRLITALEDRGSLERSLVILTSDHGEGLGDHGEQTHGFFAYDSTIRVPLIIRPGRELGTFSRGKKITEPVSLIDLPTTMADAIGLPLANGQGLSLLPALQGKALPKRSIVFESLGAEKFAGAAPILGVLDGGQTRLETPTRERYAVEADPAQLNNLYAPSEAANFDALIPSLGWSNQHTKTGQLSDERIAQLEALGYMDSDGSSAKDNAPDAKDRTGIMELLAPLEYGFFTPQSIVARNKTLLADYGPQPNIIHQMATNLRLFGFINEAIAITQVGLEAHPSSTLLNSTRAKLTAGQQQKLALVNAIMTHLEKSPDDITAQFDLGLTLHYLQRYEEARLAYESVLATHPEHLRARLMLARVFGMVGETDKAIQLLSAEDKPTSPVLECELGRLLFSFKGDLQKAGTHIQHCAEAGAPLDAASAYILSKALHP